MNHFDVMLLPYIDEQEESVAVLGVITNTTNSKQTISAMTSGVFELEITDSEGRPYYNTPGTLQAPHSVVIRPGKSYIHQVQTDTPESAVEEWEDIEMFKDDTIITDPVEFEQVESREDVIFAPSIPLDLERELTATIGFSCSDEWQETSESFIPAELERKTKEQAVPNSVDVDEEASISM